jgi:NTP pyrophosphatase (non-canonical NTP hydrolase)
MTLTHPCNLTRSYRTSELSIALELAQCKARRNRDTLAHTAADVIRQLVIIANSSERLSAELTKQALMVANNVETFL